MDASAAIRNLAARYCLAIDDGRLDVVAAMFAPDATFAARYGPPLQGRAAIAEFLAANAASQEASLHSIQGHLVEPDGPDRAVGIVQVSAELSKGGSTTGFALRCHDRYTLLEGRWLFAYRGVAVRCRRPDVPGWSLAETMAEQDGAEADPQTGYVLDRVWPSSFC